MLMACVCGDRISLMKERRNSGPLAKGEIFTKLDLREAYYRVRIKEGDEWKTSFNCPLRSFQGAPAVFMQLINKVLHALSYQIEWFNLRPNSGGNL